SGRIEAYGQQSQQAKQNVLLRVDRLYPLELDVQLRLLEDARADQDRVFGNAVMKEPVAQEGENDRADDEHPYADDCLLRRVALERNQEGGQRRKRLHGVLRDRLVDLADIENCGEWRRTLPAGAVSCAQDSPRPSRE